MTEVMPPANPRDSVFRDRDSAAKVYSPVFRAVNGKTSPSQAPPSSRTNGAHASNGQGKQDRPRDIDSRAAQRSDASLRASPGQSSPLASPAKRKRIPSDAEPESSAKMVLLPSSRTGTNTSNTTINTVVTARATPPRRIDDVDPLGPEADQAEQSQDEDMDSTEDNEQGSAEPEHDRSWHGRDERERERYRSRAGSDEHADSQAGQLSRATTTTTTTNGGQDPSSASDLARRDTEVSEVTAAGVQVLNPKKRKRVCDEFLRHIKECYE